MARYINELKLLIKKISGLDEEEENFDICVQFADSNLKYHRFLSPDSHKLNRTLIGLTQKFEIHCQYDKASAFKKYTEKFLSNPLGIADPKSDTHYAVLKLLFSLANSPTNASYTPPAPKPLPQEEEQFDWGAYLNEGIDIDLRHFSQVSSDDEESDGDEPIVETEKHATFLLPPDSPALPSATKHDMGIGQLTHEWLERHLVVQYWQRKTDVTELSCSTHESANLRLDWENYLSRTNELHTWTNKSPISEHHIIREFLWVFAGVRESHIFLWDGEKFVPNKSILLTHLTDTSLQSLLLELSHYASIVQQLDQFVRSATDPPPRRDEVHPGVSKTYQACAAAISSYLCEVRTELVQLEQWVLKQEDFCTVSSIIHKLAPRFTELNLLTQLLANGIHCKSETSCNAERASCLLGELYRLLLECGHQLPHLPGKMSLLMLLWIQTLQPYIDIIDNWISRGQLLDPQREFVIRKNESSQAKNEAFWDQAFSIHCPEPTSTPDDGIDSEGEGQTKPLTVPEFLLPILQEVVLTGKSMYLLECLGCLKLVTNSTGEGLYETFVTTLENKLGCHLVRESPLSLELLQITDSHTVANAQSLSSGDAGSALLCPVDILLASSLHVHVSQRYRHVSATLLEVFQDKHKLSVHFQTIQRFLLMEAGDVMSLFCSQIFDRVRLGEPWHDLSFLNMALHEALHPSYQDQLDCLHVTLDNTEKRSKAEAPSHLLDAISLQYMVPWPINIVLTSSSMQVYQQVFTFLMQIKRAKYALEHLRFSDLVQAEREDPITGQPISRPSNSKMHCMHIFRLRLLHFVNSLHHHIMTRILQSSRIEFEKRVRECTDLDGVIRAHQRYVTSLYQHSLLHERVKLVRVIISKVFDMAHQFAEHWQEGAHSISLVNLGSFETEYNKCLQFLSSSLLPVIKRGLHPHLESLAFALVTSNQSS